MTVRCKFKVVTKVATDNPAGFTMSFAAVTSGSPDNDKFFQFTPWGTLSFGTVNEAAAAQFKEGDEVFIDISPAVQPASSDAKGPAASETGDMLLAPHQERVVAEHDDLHAKLIALEKFLGSEHIAKVAEEEVAALREQAVHMSNYVGVLWARIAFWRKTA